MTFEKIRGNQPSSIENTIWLSCGKWKKSYWCRNLFPHKTKRIEISITFYIWMGIADSHIFVLFLSIDQILLIRIHFVLTILFSFFFRVFVFRRNCFSDSSGRFVSIVMQIGIAPILIYTKNAHRIKSCVFFKSFGRAPIKEFDEEIRQQLSALY